MDEPPERMGQGHPARLRPASAGPTRAPGGWRGRGILETVMGFEALWAVATVAVLVLLTWRSPWGQRFGDLFEGRIAGSDIVAPFDLDLPDEARTAERIEQARRAVDDLYLFDARAGDRVEQEIDEGLLPGAKQGPADPAVAAALRSPRGQEALAAMCRIARVILSEKIIARSDTLPRDRAITVRYFGGAAETSLRDPSQITDIGRRGAGRARRRRGCRAWTRRSPRRPASGSPG